MRDLVGVANPFGVLTERLFGLTGVVANLIAGGATTLLVPNLPDLGAIPEFANSADSASATAVSQAWNAGLLDLMTILAAQTTADIFYLDVFGVFNDLLADPGAFGFTNTTDECRSVETLFGAAVGENECANADQFVFWDEIHPTTAAHQSLGDAAFQLLSTGNPLGVRLTQDGEVPAPAPVLLVALGLLLVGRRRTARSAPLRQG